MAPPGPVKIGHKKDGCQRRSHRFHVSRPPPLTRPLDPILLETYVVEMSRQDPDEYFWNSTLGKLFTYLILKSLNTLNTLKGRT